MQSACLSELLACSTPFDNTMELLGIDIDWFAGLILVEQRVVSAVERPLLMEGLQRTLAA